VNIDHSGVGLMPIDPAQDEVVACVVDPDDAEVVWRFTA
jgi:hypothetical protein